PLRPLRPPRFPLPFSLLIPERNLPNAASTTTPPTTAERAPEAEQTPSSSARQTPASGAAAPGSKPRTRADHPASLSPGTTPTAPGTATTPQTIASAPKRHAPRLPATETLSHETSTPSLDSPRTDCCPLSPANLRAPVARVRPRLPPQK